MLKTFSITDVGKVRKINQDYVYTCENPVGTLPNLFILADGMGGHKAGDYASQATVDCMVGFITASSEENPITLIKDAVAAANLLVYRKSHEDEAYEGMGTTAVVASCIGDKLQVANVGDSRLYLVNDKITQITRDHSLVEEMVRLGTIDRDKARIHPDKNIITRAVGVCEKVEPDFFTVDIKKGDVILMCSDGLSNMLEDEEIRMLLEGSRDVVEKTQKLVEAANRNGGRDNISVIVIEPFA